MNFKIKKNKTKNIKHFFAFNNLMIYYEKYAKK